MIKEKVVYIEVYRNNKIKIYGKGRDWFWIVAHCSSINKNIYSPESYYSLESAINNARKHVDRKKA